jgi:lipoprotein-releasing system permease protein
MTVSILIVAGFGIYNILNMSVTQKRREIAILRSIGYEPLDILRLFFVQGLILGALGGLIGIALGYGLCSYLATIQVSPARMIGSGTTMMSFAPKIYLRAFFLAFGSAGLAGLLPARSAGKLTPIDIIRSEES